MIVAWALTLEDTKHVIREVRRGAPNLVIGTGIPTDLGYNSQEEEAFVSAYEQEWAEEDEESMFLGMYPAINADEEAMADGCKATSPIPIAMAACKEPTAKTMAEQEITSSYSAAVEWAAEINADYIMDAVPLCMQVTNKTEHKTLSDHIRSGHVSDLPNGMSCDSCTKGKRTNIPAFVNKMYPSADFDTAFMQSTM